MRSCPRSRGSGGLARFAGASGSKAVPRTGLKTGSRSPPRQRGCLLGPGKVAGFPVRRTEVAPPVGRPSWHCRSLPAASVSLALLHPATDTARVPSPHSPRRPPPQQSRPSPAGHLLLSSSLSSPLVLPAPQPPADPSRAAATAASRQAGEDDASLSTSSRRSRFEEGETPNGARKQAAGLPEGAA